MPHRPISRPIRHRAGQPTRNNSDPESESGSEESATGSESESDSKAEPILNKTHNATRNLSTLKSSPPNPSAASFPSHARVSKQQDVPETDTTSESDGTESEGDSASSSDPGSDSSEDNRPAPIRPVFMSKAKRASLASKSSQSQSTFSSSIDLEARKRAEADAILQSHLEKEALAAEARKKAWDDDDAQAQAEADIDDTDDLDLETEYSEWKLRELLRLKRDREHLIAGEKEREEIDRRRNLSAQDREREDNAFIQNQEDERQQRRAEGQSGGAGTQRYFHKGAFFAEEHSEKRNLANAQYEDAIGDRDIVPDYLKVRDATILGRKSRTRHRDLKTEDTGEWGRYENKSFGDERNGAATGANNADVGDRKRSRYE